jgi:N-acetylglutamate synthase-like GNAT family acetyltransferase
MKELRDSTKELTSTVGCPACRHESPTEAFMVKCFNGAHEPEASDYFLLTQRTS